MVSCGLLIVIVAACGRRDGEPPALEADVQRPYRPGIRFDPDTMRPGTRIGELVLDSLLRRDVAAGRDADVAVFRGEIPLAGSTRPHTDADLSQTTVCFEADSASAARLPRFDGDERRAWFCFDNSAVAAEVLAPPGAIVGASITIDRFTSVRGFSDEVNSARLVRVSPRP